MPFDKREMIEALKLEIQVIEKGGYDPSVHSPHEEPRIFRDSVTCLNLGLSDNEKKEPCSSCFLIEFVPPQFRNSNDDPCHKIPLNEKGDTVESLVKEGDRDKLEKTLLAWLRKTIACLEAELAAEAK
jgi:hypothetical protein